MIDVDDLKQQANGRWIGTLNSLGVNVRTDGKHGPCPLCGGDDRFRLDTDGSGYICNQCGAGDSISLVSKFLGIEFKEALKKIADELGNVGIDTVIKKKSSSVKANLNKVWRSSIAITPDDPVGSYLKSRGLTVSAGKLASMAGSLRYCAKCYESETKTEMPAMVALVIGVDGKPVSIHRTYLTPGGTKAAIGSCRKLMPSGRELSGAAIRLLPAKKGRIGVAEGIETALACARIHKIPTWSLVNSTLMESFKPPEGIKEIFIFGDNDNNFTGQKSAYVLANRLHRKKYNVFVDLPDLQGDWADQMEQYAKDNSN